MPEILSFILEAFQECFAIGMHHDESFKRLKTEQAPVSEFMASILLKNTTTKRSRTSQRDNTLYNAPSTINHYHQQEVQHDMHGGWAKRALSASIVRASIAAWSDPLSGVRKQKALIIFILDYSKVSVCIRRMYHVLIPKTFWHKVKHWYLCLKL